MPVQLSSKEGLPETAVQARKRLFYHDGLLSSTIFIFAHSPRETGSDAIFTGHVRV